MMLDNVIVFMVVGAASLYLVWRFMPKPKRKAACGSSPCGACPAKEQVRTP